VIFPEALLLDKKFREGRRSSTSRLPSLYPYYRSKVSRVIMRFIETENFKVFLTKRQRVWIPPHYRHGIHVGGFWRGGVDAKQKQKGTTLTRDRAVTGTGSAKFSQSKPKLSTKTGGKPPKPPTPKKTLRGTADLPDKPRSTGTRFTTNRAQAASGVLTTTDLNVVFGSTKSPKRLSQAQWNNVFNEQMATQAKADLERTLGAKLTVSNGRVLAGRKPVTSRVVVRAARGMPKRSSGLGSPVGDVSSPVFQ
jgi:hypothetical protein